MMLVEDLKKTVRAVDLAVAAGRKRQSPRTGFVHLFPADETAADTIPIYENLCFALALFRQKTAESVLEGKGLVERLLAFQTPEGNFPGYLHDFPRCWDSHLALKAAPIFIHLLRDFGAVVNAEFKEKVDAALKKALRFAERETHPMWKSRLMACRAENPGYFPIATAQEWFEWVVTSQLVKKEGVFPIPYHFELQVFLGEHAAQERGEPQPLPIEYILAEKQGIGKRLMRDHPHQILSGLLFPFSSSLESTEQAAWLPREGGGLRVLWNGASVHSLLFPNGKWDGNRVIFELPEGVEIGRDDLVEASLFADISPETSVWIEEKKGLVFHLGETVSIRTPEQQIDVQFSLIEGEGDFCGQISRSNRPGQISCRGANQFEAYDWRIGMRTLRRKGACKIAVEVKIRQ